MPEAVHVIGATGRSGLALCRALLADGVAVVPVVRNPGKWQGFGLAVPPRAAALDDAPALGAALADATRIVSAAYAWHTTAILAAAPAAARLVLLGTTRKYASEPDRFGRAAAAGEAALLASGRCGVMLHPTMIYGAGDEQNVRRLAALLARFPVLPLPGGGRNLVQPIHQDDVTRAIRAALAVTWERPRAMVIAGPTALPYSEFAAAVAAACGLQAPRVMPVPAWLLVALAAAAGRLPRRIRGGLPAVGAAEIRRLLEDKAFDITPMVETLGITPIPLAEGLARTFGGAHKR
ncbi:MAG: NAD(P)H-binding protein [Acidisphaera sp.]|nr:NAD(P)H-binding protein [Acidisphaera sp.]